MLLLEIDPDGWIGQLVDEQRKTEIELVEGQELELSIQWRKAATVEISVRG